MELRVFTEPQQGATYAQLLGVARAAEELGFGAFFRSDHLLRIGPGDPGPGPSESWVTLAAIARETERIRIGTLLSSATFRHPGVLAVAVAGVDEMSGGRVELGLGAGWYEDEHRAYGIPFPPLGERFERLEEQLAILTGMWATPPGERFSYAGRHYRLEPGPALPRPCQQPRPPLIVGGRGLVRTPALAARYADELNVSFGLVADCAELFAALDVACGRIERDPATVVRSVALTTIVGTNEAECRRRAASAGQDLERLRVAGLAGAPAEVLARLAAFAEVGVTRVYCQILDLDDLDHLALIASEVLAPSA